MKKILLASLVSASLVLPVAASAAVSSAKVDVVSNYVFRGQTQTKDGAAIQAGYDIKQSKADTGWYAGVFGSNVNKGLEIDLFGGWKGSFGTQKNMGYDVGAAFYKYTDSAFSPDITEIYGGINYETAYAKLFLGSGSGIKNYTYLDLGASFIVMKDLNLDVHYGHMSEGGTNDVSASLGSVIKGFNLSLGLTYEDSGVNGTEFFVTVGKSFDL